MRSGGSKMDVVLLLSRRFRAQDINAPPDYTETTNALLVKEEAHDSGTGSDEETMTRASPQQSKPLARTNASEHQEHSAQVYDNPDASRSSRDGYRPPSSTSLGHSPASSSPVGFRCLAADDFPPVALYSSTDRHSPTGSDYERSSLGLETSTTLSDLGVDCSSSSSSSSCEGEDLVMMTGNRKRHQLSDDSCIFPDEEEDDEDDDIEICELFGDDDDEDDDEDDVLGGRRRCRRPVAALGSTSSSPTFLSSTIPFVGRGASPRKRCRQDAGGEDATTSLRPNLDFYKMQKTSIVRRNCIINRPRPAKLMVLNGSQGQKSNATTFGPSSFTFRSLEFN